MYLFGNSLRRDAYIPEVNGIQATEWKLMRRRACSDAAAPATRNYKLKSVGLISVIDDDAAVRNSTKELLRSFGYAVVTFESAEEFLNSDRHETLCVITDVRMPSMSGFELQIRLKAEGDRTPIIFITAVPADKIRKLALANGAHGFLLKPFSEQSLIECLESALLARTC